MSRRLTQCSRNVRALALAAGACAFAVTAFAQTAAPLPPRRPQGLAPAPAAPLRPPEQPQIINPTPDAAPPERVLSREQMRLCSQEWQKKKRDGSAVGWLWRDFAQSCAAEHGGG